MFRIINTGSSFTNNDRASSREEAQTTPGNKKKHEKHGARVYRGIAHKKFTVQRRGTHWRLWWYHADLAALHNKRYRVGERQSEEGLREGGKNGPAAGRAGNELAVRETRKGHSRL